jgi:glyoxylase-like metal-dependent hydrolase (beta-lactamase superfamily II)
MIYIQKFTFNPFQENSYIVYNEDKKAIIIDPGMYEPNEFKQFFKFIEQHELEPMMLLNTHTHLDHVFGNAQVLNKFQIPFGFHELDKVVFDNANAVGLMYGIPFDQSPEPTFYIRENETIQLGKDSFKILLTPGHSPGSVCFYNQAQNIVISGDVLFQQSIGRTDLPGGNYETLMNRIHAELMALPNETIVYCGHGPETTIGSERMNNPFLTMR